MYLWAGKLIRSIFPGDFSGCMFAERHVLCPVPERYKNDVLAPRTLAALSSENIVAIILSNFLNELHSPWA